MQSVSLDALGSVWESARVRLTCDRANGPSPSPNLDTASDFVERLSECIHEMTRVVGLPPALAALVTGSVLQASFPVFVQCRYGDPERASDVLLHIWASHASAFGLGGGLGARPAPLADPFEPPPDVGECLMLFNLAVGKRLRQDSAAAEARRILRRLVTLLDLSFDELGQVLGVRGETVRRWERGLVSVPLERLAALTDVQAALDRLLGSFRPERLSIAIRRPAGLFGGESALTWILRGRINEVADRYDRVLTYQQ